MSVPKLASPDPGLDRTFAWAVQKALSYVQTGKHGPVDRHERGPGRGSVAYEPSYWAGYTIRTAYYSRDFCHQADGAHLLGLRTENFTMLRRFAETATAARKWFPLWALNFDGSPFRLDWNGDESFVREVPAVFELVEQCWRQFLWTGDPRLIRDPVLIGYCTKAMSEFIRLHDTRRPNGVAEGTGTGDIFRGSATYNEVHSDHPLVEAGDGIACQYQAHRAFARILEARGERGAASRERGRADRLKRYFNDAWSRDPASADMVRGYDADGRAQTDWGLENSWFLPLKGIVDAGPRLDRLMDLIRSKMDDPESRPSNIEAISYLPDVFFARGDRESAWKWMRHIHGAPEQDRDYPEISFTVVSHVIRGLLGVAPDAPGRGIATLPQLPDALREIAVEGIAIGDATFSVAHRGVSASRVVLTSGAGNWTWSARFPGRHPVLEVDGVPRKARRLSEEGMPVSRIDVPITPGKPAQVRIPAA